MSAVTRGSAEGARTSKWRTWAQGRWVSVAEAPAPHSASRQMAQRSSLSGVRPPAEGGYWGSSRLISWSDSLRCPVCL